MNSSRRSFLKTTSAGAAAITLTAASYGRVIGANDRIGIGLIGCGDRGATPTCRAYTPTPRRRTSRSRRCAIRGGCAREMAAATGHEVVRPPGAAVRLLPRHAGAERHRRGDDRLARPPAHHAPGGGGQGQEGRLLREAAGHGHGDAASRPATRSRPAASSSRSAPRSAASPPAPAAASCSRPACWARCRGSSSAATARSPTGTATLKDGRRRRTWTGRSSSGDRPMRPFRADLFTGWYGYRDFSDGPIAGLRQPLHRPDATTSPGASSRPARVCLGGTFTWKDEHKFTCPDHVQALWIYPEGFMVSYSTNFGNGGGNALRICGDQGAMDLTNWTAPTISSDGAAKTGKLRQGEARRADRHARPLPQLAPVHPHPARAAGPRSTPATSTPWP